MHDDNPEVLLRLYCFLWSAFRWQRYVSTCASLLIASYRNVGDLAHEDHVRHSIVKVDCLTGHLLPIWLQIGRRILPQRVFLLAERRDIDRVMMRAVSSH